jgi:hypothetical protein
LSAFRGDRATNGGCTTGSRARKLVKRAVGVQNPCHWNFQCAFRDLRRYPPALRTVLVPRVSGFAPSGGIALEETDDGQLPDR